MTYSAFYKRNRHNVDHAGHFERKREGEGWETCTIKDARMAIGHATAEELRREPGPARSEWGVFYRYVHHRGEAKRAG